MPKVYNIVNSDPRVSVAYVIDHPVGLGCPNVREDVLLVQHLLHIAWADCGFSRGFRPPGENMPLRVDGLYGPTTERFIKYFQEEANRRGAGVMHDGRVDPVRTGQSSSGLSRTFYTILAMNSARNPRRNSNQAHIAGDPGFPQELRKHFYIDW